LKTVISEFKKTIYEGLFSIMTLGSMKAMNLEHCCCEFRGSIKDEDKFK